MANVLTELLKNLYKNPDTYQESSKNIGLTAKNTHVSGVNDALSNFHEITDTGIISGLITDIRRDSITLLLEHSESLTARLTAPLPLSIGETASFTVTKKDGNQIFLSLCKNNDVKDSPILLNSENILKKLGFTVSEKNIEIVKNLLELKAPISKENIKNIVSLSGKFPDASVSDFILLKGADIPVTEDNLNLVNNFSESIISEAKNAINEIAEAINKETNPAVRNELKNEFNETLRGFFMDSAGNFTENSAENTAGNLTSASGYTEVISAFESGNRISDGNLSHGYGSEPVTQDILDAQDLNFPVSDAAALPASSDAGSALKSSLSDIPQKYDLKDNSANDLKENLNDSFKSLFLAPEKISQKENLQKINKRLLALTSAIQKLSQKIAETKDNDTEAQELSHTERLIAHAKLADFVNSVFPFMFVPVSFKNENTESELYVYEKKKNFRDSDSVSVCLHLAMKKLGDTDIFITLSGQNLTVSISAANEASKKVFESEIDTLSNTLNEKGFKLTCSVGVTKEKITGPAKLLNFIDTCDKSDTQNYTFDVRT